MTNRQDATHALDEFRNFIRHFEATPIGLGIVKSGGEWCVLYARARAPAYAEEIPREIGGVKVILDFGNPPSLDSARRRKPLGAPGF